MLINNIFRSSQGESSYVGLPCIFIRLAGCNLRCSYCDTKYAYNEGTEMTIDEVYEEVNHLGQSGDILEITGGEPLLQVDAVNELIKKVKKNIPMSSIGTILIETNGSIDIGKLKNRWSKNIVIIMDWKLPSSKMTDKMLVSNLRKLKTCDELKFVIGDMKDYNYMKKLLEEHENVINCQILISTIWEEDIRKQVVEKMLEDGIEARFQVQIHKIIWDKDTRGV